MQHGHRGQDRRLYYLFTTLSIPVYVPYIRQYYRIIKKGQTGCTMLPVLGMRHAMLTAHLYSYTALQSRGNRYHMIAVDGSISPGYRTARC